MLVVTCHHLSGGSRCRGLHTGWDPQCKLSKGPHMLWGLSDVFVSHRVKMHKTTNKLRWKLMDQTAPPPPLYSDCSLLLERISVRITKSGHLSGKQMDTDVVFRFTGCLCLANSFSRRSGYVLSCFNGSEWPRPFSNTNDIQSHKALAAWCYGGCMPTV